MPLSTQHYPAIKHAVIALASLHERFENNDQSILSSNYDLFQGGYALQQYNRAIIQLTKPPTNGEEQPIDVFLVACILFACFEVSINPLGLTVSTKNGRISCLRLSEATTALRSRIFTVE